MTKRQKEVLHLVHMISVELIVVFTVMASVLWWVSPRSIGVQVANVQDAVKIDR